MGSLVSSRLDYMNKNPNAQIPFAEMLHELEHLKVRERISSCVTVVGTLLLVICLAGAVFGSGGFFFGILAATVAGAATYAYFTREAESALRNKQIQWMGGVNKKVSLPAAEEALSWFKNWFST